MIHFVFISISVNIYLWLLNWHHFHLLCLCLNQVQNVKAFSSPFISVTDYMSGQSRVGVEGRTLELNSLCLFVSDLNLTGSHNNSSERERERERGKEGKEAEREEPSETRERRDITKLTFKLIVLLLKNRKQIDVDGVFHLSASHFFFYNDHLGWWTNGIIPVHGNKKTRMALNTAHTTAKVR